jgi:hypothetical protein
LSELPTGISWIQRRRRIPKISNAPHPYIRDDDLYRQLFTYLEQLEDPVRLRNPGAEVKPDTGDAAVNRQLSTYPS